MHDFDRRYYLRVRPLYVLLALSVWLLTADAQVNSPQPTFAVASIKPSPDRPAAPSGIGAPDRFERRYVPLVSLIAYAYNVADIQIEGGPGWVRSTRFDVEARADMPATTDTMRLMVRQLLADRFQLKVRREVQSRPRYALVMARDDGRLGPGIRPSTTDCDRSSDRRPANDAAVAAPVRPCRIYTRASTTSMVIGFERVPIAQLVQSLQVQTGRLVVDQTALSDSYDIELEVSRPAASTGSFVPDDGLSVFTALQEQLGLKLVPNTGLVEMLLIESVSELVPN